jgi:hypothetical protein
MLVFWANLEIDIDSNTHLLEDIRCINNFKLQKRIEGKGKGKVEKEEIEKRQGEGVLENDNVKNK